MSEVHEDDAELVARAVRIAGHARLRRLPRWSHMKSVFGFGSTSANLICERFGHDPDEMVGGCAVCEQSYDFDDDGEVACACDREEEEAQRRRDECLGRYGS